MNPLWLVVPMLPLLSGPSTAPPTDDCEHTVERTATLPAAGADVARILARAGSLRIEGKAGLREVRARGRVCASTRGYMEATRLVTRREGGQLHLEVTTPEMTGIGHMYARMDLVIEVPESLALDVKDSSGNAEIRHVATLRLDDSSGELEIQDVRGELSVTDSSGEVRIDGVRGDVWLSDSSGDLYVRNVAGNVLVEQDSSGDIDVRNVTGTVAVRRDSSGDIQVSSVRGDFTVARDGSGSIRYDEVGGRVRIPERKR